MNTLSKNVLTVIMLFVIFPIGIILMWLITTWKKSVKWSISAIYAFIILVTLLNRLVSFNHPIQYFESPNITEAVGLLIFLLVPVAAITFAIATRKKYWIAAIVIALLSLPIDIYYFFDQYSCQAEFCGLGDLFATIIVPILFGTIAFIVALISAPKVVRTEKDRRASRKAFALFLLVILTPVFVIILSSVVSSLTQLETVTIKIQPGAYPPIIDLTSQNLTPVAILSSAPSFNPTTDIDPTTVTFGSNDATSIRTSIQDINHDGVPDLVFYFPVNQAGIQSGDTQACISARLKNGVKVEGCDTIRTNIKDPKLLH